MTDPDQVEPRLRHLEAGAEVPDQRRDRSRAAMYAAFDAARHGEPDGEAELLQLHTLDDAPPPRRLLVPAAAAAMLVVAVASLLLVTGRTDDRTDVSNVAMVTIDDVGETLQPGTIDLTVIQPGLRFDVTEPMLVEQATEERVRLRRPSDDETIDFATVASFVDPTGEVRPDITDVGAWVAARDDFPAQSNAVTAADPDIGLEVWTGTLVSSDACPDACPIAIDEAGDPIDLTAGQRNTIWTITLPTGEVVVGVTSVRQTAASDTAPPFAPLVRSAWLAD